MRFTQREAYHVAEAVQRCAGHIFYQDSYALWLAYQFDTEFPLRKMTATIRVQREMLERIMLPENMYLAALPELDAPCTIEGY